MISTTGVPLLPGEAIRGALLGEETTDETGVGVVGRTGIDLEGDLAGERERVNSIESRCW